MAEVDALFRLLKDAPPRSAEIVRRYALDGTPMEALATLYAVDEVRVRVLVFRALLDVSSGGTARIADDAEGALLEALFGAGTSTEPQVVALRALVERLKSNAAGVKQQLETAAKEFEQSPDRGRDEWFRRAAIALVLVLSAWFYWREANKPRPPPEKRPVLTPASNN